MDDRPRFLITGAALFALVAAAPASAATITAAATAKVVKPLILNRVQDLDLGLVVLGPGTFSGATVSLSRTGGLVCPAPLTCTGATQVAIYNVSGTNNTTVRISAPNVTLVNQNNSSRALTLIPDGPATILLTNSGAPGHDFNLGGSITLDSTVEPGTYQGTFNVTVDY